MMKELIAKYDMPVPRYTSYPTVPYWATAPDADQWRSHLGEALSAKDSGWSLYLHVPFCETLCTFCGCNTIITKDHGKEDPYVRLLLAEWENYLAKVPALRERPLQHLHLGGGTPTFLGPEALKALLRPMLEATLRDRDAFEGSLEADPRRTNAEQLGVLREMGFNRLSLGVQDFNPEVQRLVNRLQSFELTAELTRTARDMGYRSVNFDLIYGLAKQTPASMSETVDRTLELAPDRIALYSFALVPWIKPAQRLFKDEDLPTGQAKRELYELARRKFLAAGYIEVGMDHFAKADDALALAMQKGRLHRNFMGYTDHRSNVLLGLGVSAISETPWSFHQNEKVLAQYEAAVQAGKWPTTRGHLLDEEDRSRREQILSLMTRSRARWANAQQREDAAGFLDEMVRDGLVRVEPEEVVLTEAGKPFLRNVCVFFDEHLRRKQPQTRIFSSSI